MSCHSHNVSFLLRTQSLPHDKFVHEDTDAPYVRRTVVPLPCHHLGAKVLDGAAKGVRPVFRAVDEFLGKPKIDDCDVSLFVDEEVLGLQVSVDVSVVMHVLLIENVVTLAGRRLGRGGKTDRRKGVGYG